MLYYSYFNYMLVLLIVIATCVQYSFCMHMSQVTSSHFAKYFCDIFSEYITTSTVMFYAMPDAIWVTPPWLYTLCSGATVWSD
jgi:hypothetical protein